MKKAKGLFRQKSPNPYKEPKKLYEELKNLIAANDVEKLQNILEKASIKDIQRANTIRRASLLHYACKRGRKRCIDLLLNASSDINQFSRLASRETATISYRHQTPLHVACEAGQLGAVKKLLAHPDIVVHHKDYHRCTPLEIAQNNNYTDIALYIQTHEQISKKKSKLVLANLQLKIDAAIFTEKDSCFKSHVTILDLSQNLLSVIPPVLFNMENLKKLNLANNAISLVPSGIKVLKNLDSIDLDFNRLELAPFVLGTMEQLKHIKLHNNPLSYVPPAIRERDSNLKKYLQEGPTSVEPKRVKVITVGPPGAGKTYLLRNIKRDSLNAPGSPLRSRAESLIVSGTEAPTDEVTQISEFSLNKFRISAWDFGKSDMYYRTHQYLMTGRAIYIIVVRAYEIEPRILDYWLQQIRSVSLLGKSNVIVVATHTDDQRFTQKKSLKANHCLKLYAAQSQVDGCIFLSNKTKENFSSLRKILISLAEDHILSNITITGSWNQVSLHCRYLLENCETSAIEWETMSTLMESYEVPTEEYHDLLEFLRDSGIICYQTIARGGNPDFIVLNPVWLTNLILSVHQYMKNNQITDGIIENEKLGKIFSFPSRTLLEPLLNLLSSIEIIYVMRGEPARSLIPSLLPDGLPDNVSDFWPPQVQDDVQQYGRVYRFHLPSSEVFSRLIVRFLHILNIKMLLIWIQGIILQLGSELAIISYDVQEQNLNIKVRAPKKLSTRLLRVLVNSVDSLIESVYPAPEKIEIEIPCLHCLRYNPYTNPYKFSKKETIEAWTSGSPFVYCHGIISSSRCVRVDILAPDLSFGDIPLIKDLEIGVQIGSGGFGKVYKGELEGELVAIKELCGDEDSFASMFEEFSREVYTMKSLDHPNLVGLFGITVNPLRMVMEFVSGGDLYHIIHSNKELSLRLRIRIALDVAKGMRYLQNISPPIMHRDLRSPNILIETLEEDAEVIAKVADFGLALSVAPSASGFLGTWQWHAPEVLDSNSLFYDEAADIYSFAILLWEIFTGGYPFEEYRTNNKYSKQVGETEEGKPIRHFRIQNMKQAIIREDLRPTFNNSTFNVHPALQLLIERCWQPEKGQRPKFKEIVEILGKTFEEFFPGKNIEYKTRNVAFSRAALLQSTSPSNSPLPERKTKKSKFSLSDYGKQSDCFDLKEKPLSIHFHANKVWVGCDKGSVLVYNARDCSLVTVHKSHQTRIYSIVSIARHIWTSSEEGSIFIYDAYNSTRVKELLHVHEHHMIRSLVALHQEKVSCVWSCAPLQNNISVWNSESFEKLYSFQTDDIPINCFYINFDHIWIGTHKDVMIYLIDYKTNKFRAVTTLVGHTRKINGFEHPVEDELWSCSDDGKIFVWSLSRHKQIATMDVNSGTIRCLHRINNNVWAGGSNNSIVCWCIETRTPKSELEISDAVQCIAKVGTSVWTGTADKRLRVIPKAAL